MAKKLRTTSPARINAVPLPEIRIPDYLAKEFGADLRVVIRHPWVTGIPVPERLIPRDLRAVIGKEFEVILTPRMR